VFLLDIEGTTTPIAFVTNTLFPYARAHLSGYLAEQGKGPECAQVIGRLHAEYEHDREAGADVPPWSPLDYAGWLMDRDRKSPALKDLQGRVWEEGYRNGTLVGQVFGEVPAALARWNAEGAPVGIFSSGSVLAQQWLFRRSTAGDLTPLLRWYFDTGIGAKQDPASYTRIAERVDLVPGEIVFVSDVLGELNAARAAGLRTVMSVRPGNQPQPEHEHRVVTTFDEL